MKNILLTTTFFIGLQVSAQNQNRVIYSYDHWVPQWIQNYQSELLNYSSQRIQPMTSGELSPSCRPVLQKALDRGTLDIRYVFGYFDDSATGENIIWDGVNWGRSPSLDGHTFEALRQSLTAPCTGDLVACGFKQYGSPASGSVTLEKYIKVYDQTLPVRLTLAYSSISQD